MKYPIATPHKFPFIGIFIRVKLSLPRLHQYKRNVRGNITLFVASVYHPVYEVEHTNLINTLSSIMSSVPKTADFIGGHDFNDNIGICTKMYRKAEAHEGLTTAT